MAVGATGVLDKAVRDTYERLLRGGGASPFAQYADDPHGFIFGYCYTVDEADKANPKKLIPDLPHTRLLIERVCIDRLHPLLIPKSRRLVISWTLTACEVWECLTGTHRAIGVQSKKFEDSANLVQRHWEMLKALDSDKFPVAKSTDESIEWDCGLTCKRYKGGKGDTGKLEFSNGSSITAVAEGENQLRQYGLSWIRQEEIAFWDRQQESYDAAIECCQPPAGVERGGQLIAVSTLNPSWFEDFIDDTEHNAGPKAVKRKFDITQPIFGVKEWRTSVGANVLEIHHTADPGKRSPEWIRHERYEMGRSQRGWDREMDLKRGMFTGMAVFGDCFNERLHVATEPVKWDGVSPIFRSWDYGNTPCCFFSYLHPLANGDYKWRWLAEICTDTRPLGSKEAPKSDHVSTFAPKVEAFCAQTWPGAEFRDVDDITGGSSKSQTDGKSCRDHLAMRGIYPVGGEISIAGRLDALVRWLTRLTGGEPAIEIDEGGCPMLVAGLKGGYRYSEIGQTGKYNETPEKNQYSHPMDTACQLASVLGNYAQRLPDPDPRDEYREETVPGRVSAFY